MTVQDSVTIALLPAQLEFLQSRHREVAISGGLGSGKSFIQGGKAYQFACENNGHPHAIVSKTHRQLHDALLPEIYKVLNLLQCPYRMKDGNKLIVEVGPKPTTFHLWTANNKAYLNWPGFNLAGGIIDEWDTFTEPQPALEYLNDRIRVPCNLPQTAITSSMEGYGDFNNRFIKEVAEDPSLAEKRHIIYACTFDNPHLRPEYIIDQVQSRDPRLALAYLYGKPCSVSGKVVYYNYGDDNRTSLQLHDFPPESPILWGCDFNKGVNATVGHVRFKDVLHAVVEIHGKLTFADVIETIQERYPTRTHYFYPDAQHIENVELLKRTFGANRVTYTPGNPRVKKRVASMHMAIMDPRTSARRYLVNAAQCPRTDESLLKQQYDDRDEPDKKGGWDHYTDAAGYLVHHVMPYVERLAPRVIAL